MSASQSHKGITITADNAYTILLDILTDNSQISDLKVAACMGFLGGEAISKQSVLNSVQTKLNTYYANSQLLVSPQTVLDLSVAELAEP